MTEIDVYETTLVELEEFSLFKLSKNDKKIYERRIVDDKWIGNKYKCAYVGMDSENVHDWNDFHFDKEDRKVYGILD